MNGLSSSASRASSEDEPNDQVRYLARYVARLGALTFVVEDHYVDRHFVDEFGLYYSRRLSLPTNSCRRIHFFSRRFTDEELDGELVKAFESPDAKEDVERSLSHDYLGFVVVRPLPDVPIGRTILRPLEGP